MLRCLTESTDADNVSSSSGVSPTQTIRNVTDTVSQKINMHTQNIITKAQNSLDVLRKFSFKPEEEEQDSQKIDDEVES